MSNITIKTFKLVPIKDFEKLALNKDPKCHKGDDGGNASAPQRTIKDIVDSSSLENTEFEPSKHYVAEQKFLQKGSGAAATPVWLPNEKQLPQFSRGSRIKRSYDDMSNILNNNSISDDLKVRLYAMARKKYKNAMSVGETDDDDAGGDEDADDDEEDSGYVSVRKKRKNKQRELAGVIRDIVDKVPIGKKQKIAYKIMNVLGKNKRHLRWDLDGTILHPPHRNLDEIVNMKMFLDLVLYKNRGSVKQLGVVADLIKPFFKDFEPLILNEKLLNKARKTAKVKGNLPQYVSWYKSWNN